MTLRARKGWLRRKSWHCNHNKIGILRHYPLLLGNGIHIKVELSTNQLSTLEVDCYEWIRSNRPTRLSPSGPTCLTRHVRCLYGPLTHRVSPPLWGMLRTCQFRFQCYTILTQHVSPTKRQITCSKYPSMSLRMKLTTQSKMAVRRQCPSKDHAAFWLVPFVHNQQG